MTYVDSSALVAVYVPDRFSGTARRAIGALAQVPFTALHELEVANAFAMLAGRRTITAAEHRAIRAQLRDDIEAQRLAPVALDWSEVFGRAGGLSDAHTATLFTRSLDLLHVAAARALECEAFVSADDRQLAAAKAAGLTVVDITRPARSARRPR